MADINQLLSDITNTEITKNELQRQLDILTNEYELETKELQRLNNKNLEYTTALQNQERKKQLNDDRDKRQQAKETLSNFVQELSDNFKR